MNSKPYRILVAEDDNFQRLALLDLLTMCNYDAIGVENGKLAMEQLVMEQDNFDLILLDLYMPEMDGFEVLTRIQEDHVLKNIPTVVMSSQEQNEIISSCLRQGAENYLVKPIRI